MKVIDLSTPQTESGQKSIRIFGNENVHPLAQISQKGYAQIEGTVKL